MFLYTVDTSTPEIQLKSASPFIQIFSYLPLFIVNTLGERVTISGSLVGRTCASYLGDFSNESCVLT